MSTMYPEAMWERDENITLREVLEHAPEDIVTKDEEEKILTHFGIEVLALQTVWDEIGQERVARAKASRPWSIRDSDDQIN